LALQCYCRAQTSDQGKYRGNSKRGKEYNTTAFEFQELTVGARRVNRAVWKLEFGMPSKATSVPTSIVTFYTGSRAASVEQQSTEHDEIFLLYSAGVEDGTARGLFRDGIGSPWMWDRSMTRRVTDPEEQRRGAWLIDRDYALKIEEEAIRSKAKRPEVMEWIRSELHKDPQEVLDEWLNELAHTPDYISEFEKAYKSQDYEIVGMQGCGNLTMNSWFVGFLNSDFTHGKPVFLYRREEQFEARQYTCIVKWKETRRVSMEVLRFNPYTKSVLQISGGEEKDITPEIEFAVFGQQLVRGGELVDFKTIVKQFEDIRHLFKLPNINPSGELTTAKQRRRPRMLFGDDRNDDVWFGERELTRPEKEDHLRHALTEPILLDRQFDVMGAGWDLIRAALGAPTGGGYRELKDEQALYPPRSRGEWRRYSDTVIEIYLQRNVYAYTMLGLDGAGNLIASAAGGLAGRVGQTLEGMAQNMISLGARDVLLIDEGNDVFQKLRGGYAVEPRRGRMRAIFLFARKEVGPRSDQSTSGY
jgi:hypothetical protein